MKNKKDFWKAEVKHCEELLETGKFTRKWDNLWLLQFVPIDRYIQVLRYLYYADYELMKEEDKHKDPEFEASHFDFSLHLYMDTTGLIEMTVQDENQLFQLIDAKNKKEALKQFDQVLQCIEKRLKNYSEYFPEELFNDLEESN